MAEDELDPVIYIIMLLVFVVAVIFIAFAVQPKIVGGWVEWLFKSLIEIFKLTQV